MLCQPCTSSLCPTCVCYLASLDGYLHYLLQLLLQPTLEGTGLYGGSRPTSLQPLKSTRAQTKQQAEQTNWFCFRLAGMVCKSVKASREIEIISDVNKTPFSTPEFVAGLAVSGWNEVACVADQLQTMFATAPQIHPLGRSPASASECRPGAARAISDMPPPSVILCFNFTLCFNSVKYLAEHYSPVDCDLVHHQLLTHMEHPLSSLIVQQTLLTWLPSLALSQFSCRQCQSCSGHVCQDRACSRSRVPLRLGESLRLEPSPCIFAESPFRQPTSNIADNA